MKKWVVLFLLLVVITIAGTEVAAQCSICTKTASQLGEKPARGLNIGILYLALAPFAVVGWVAFRWFKTNRIK